MNYSKLPLSLQLGMQAYIEEYIPPGGFLRAVLENNLMEAFGRADEDNRQALFDICAFVYNEAPADCWGGPLKVKAWLARRVAKVTA